MDYEDPSQKPNFFIIFYSANVRESILAIGPVRPTGLAEYELRA